MKRPEKNYVVKGYPAINGPTGIRQAVYERNFEGMPAALRRFNALLKEGRAAILFHRRPLPGNIGQRLHILKSSFPPVKDSRIVFQPLGPMLRQLGY